MLNTKSYIISLLVTVLLSAIILQNVLLLKPINIIKRCADLCYHVPDCSDVPCLLHFQHPAVGPTRSARHLDLLHPQDSLQSARQRKGNKNIFYKGFLSVFFSFSLY